MKKYRQSLIISFTQSMAALLKSGLQLQEALTVYSNIESSREGKKLCFVLRERINNGLSFSKSLETYRNSFGNLYLELVSIGENSGTIVDVFEKLSGYLKEKKETTQKLVQALIYPLIVLFTAFLVVICIMFFVFPRLKNIFEVFTENSEQIALKIDNLKHGILFTSAGIILLVVLISLFFIFRRLSEKFKNKTDKYLFMIPVFGKFLKTMNTNDFSFAMKLLSSSNVLFVQALEQAATVSSNYYYRNEVLNVKNEIVNGFDISEAFARHSVFPTYFVAWIAIAEATGNIENVFNQIHDYYSTEAKTIISNFVVSAEPIFILITGILIFIMVGQFVLPVFSLLGAL